MGPRTLPPAGTEIPATEVLRWLRRSFHPEEEIEKLHAEFLERYPGEALFFFSSGRALLTILLEALASSRARPSSRKDTPAVIIPGYTCHSVAASVVRAGLSVHPVDVDPTTLDYDRNALDRTPTENVIAIISANLYGIPNDLCFLERFARTRSIAFIDDAAQAMHARVDERFVGTFGQAGLFSFDKGKNITTVQGGALLIQDPALVPLIRERVHSAPGPPVHRVMARMMELVTYSLLLDPRLYWLPSRLLDLGGTPWAPPTPVEQYVNRLAPMASQLLERIEMITAARVERAERIRSALDRESTANSLLFPSHRAEEPSIQPAFLRLPVLLPDEASRDQALHALTEAGLGASRSYPVGITDIPQVQPHLSAQTNDTPGARAVAARMVTLPTHTYVSDKDMDRMLEALVSRGQPR